MKLNFWSEISLRIVLIFIFFILASFIPELDIMHQFFDDKLCNNIADYHNGNSYITEHYHWGYRHWLWIFMGIILAIIQFVKLLTFIFNNTD